MTYPQLATGRIDHALYLVVGCTNGRTVYPAPSAGGGGACRDPGDAPATGQWLKLVMSPRQIARLRQPLWQKAILRALARYGAVVGDAGSTGGFDIQVQSAQSYLSLGEPNPFVHWAAAQDRASAAGIGRYDAAGARRWLLEVGAGSWTSHLEIIDPCVIAGTC